MRAKFVRIRDNWPKKIRIRDMKIIRDKGYCTLLFCFLVVGFFCAS
jgi:hypothetical protein